MKVEIEDKTLIIGGSRVVLDHPISNIKVVSKKIIVIYDPKSSSKYGQFNNCKAYDFKGNYLWTAEHPTNQSADIYIEFIKTHPIRFWDKTLKIWNFACFVCEIDLDNGKLIKAEFTK